MTLPLHLWKLSQEIRSFALEFGLDFFEVMFELISYERINEIAAYGGFPTRYPHWRFGMEYDRLSKSHTYGLHKIYEMVINNDPCYAYLLEGNSVVLQKLIMAHVYAHSDFFKNNLWFEHTNRKMLDEMGNHAVRIRRYMDKLGIEKVETFIDRCLSIENLIDYHFPEVQVQEEETAEENHKVADEDKVFRFHAPAYMEPFINPPEFVEAQREKIAKEKKKKKKVPRYPWKDVMLFLLLHAPLESWEREILSILREEALYFAPQGQTKIMNEGWAAYWHSKIATQKALTSAEIVDFADAHSQAVAVSGFSINPYKLGLELFRDIEDRWNKGKFGPDYEDCTDMREKELWNRNLGLGREKIFQVRKVYNDVAFVDEFLTPEFCYRHKLFRWLFKENIGRYVIDSREFSKIKTELLKQLTNFGNPLIYVVDSNYLNRAELLLVHKYEGEELDLKWSRETLRNLTKLWKRPVHLFTRVKGEGQLWSHDGDTFHSKRYELDDSDLFD